MAKTEQKQKDELYKLCKKFIADKKPSCPESIYDCDWINEGALSLLEDICGILGYYEYPED